MHPKISIVLWLWTGRTMGEGRVPYGARHVNVMASMISRNLRMKHEIVCVTDMPEGIDGGVRIVPIWPELREHGRCYVRLKAFARGMADLLGPRFCSLDLDTVVVRPLDPLFDRPEPFVAWTDQSRATPYCGSQWMLSADAYPEVYDTFDVETARKLKETHGYFGSDQAWMAYKLPGAATWDTADGVYSFRLNILRTRGGDPVGMRFRRKVGAHGAILPENARIVHMHGLHDPSLRYIQEAVPWVKEHWR